MPDQMHVIIHDRTTGVRSVITDAAVAVGIHEGQRGFSSAPRSIMTQLHFGVGKSRPELVTSVRLFANGVGGLGWSTPFTATGWEMRIWR